MTTRKVYACSKGDLAHRTYMYELHTDDEWKSLKCIYGLHWSDEELYIDFLGGIWYVKEYKDGG